MLSQQMALLSREIGDLLRQSRTCSIPASKFIPSYHHHFGRQCRVADYGYTKLAELFEALPHVLQVCMGMYACVVVAHCFSSFFVCGCVSFCVCIFVFFMGMYECVVAHYCRSFFFVWVHVDFCVCLFVFSSPSFKFLP